MISENQSKIKTLYIYAPSVRSYGGLTLIQSLVDLNDDYMVFILNDQLALQRFPGNYILTRGGFIDQFKLEGELRESLDENSVLFCMTNKPPFRKLPGIVVTGLLSVFAIEIPNMVPITFNRRIKSMIQISLNIFLKKNTDLFLARSQEMVDRCTEKTNKKTLYYPFVTSDSPLTRSFDNPRERIELATFFYPSDAAPHKNLKNVFKAWKILIERGIRAKLVITITREAALQCDASYRNDVIEAVGFLNEVELEASYQSADALLFPSLLESFPLPIIEARFHKLPIVASEMGFIREQVDPEETFDPHSPLSMANAVQRMMGIYENNDHRPSIADLPDFLRGISLKQFE